MSNPSPERPVRLMHIPKTAGTTLASSLVRHYDRKQKHVLSADFGQNIAIYNTLPEWRKKNIRLFIGHSMFDTGIAEADAAAIITVLREPVSRVKSFIRFVASPSARHTLHDASKPFSVDEFLESGNYELTNLQVKHLTIHHGADWESTLGELGADATVALARDRLFQQVHAFGVQEYFNESWVAVWQSLGIKPPVYATMKRTRGHLHFTPEQEQKIRELNALDIELYDAAKKEFERRLRDGAVLPAQLEDFRRRQKRLGPMVTMARSTLSSVYWSYRRTRRKLLSRLSS